MQKVLLLIAEIINLWLRNRFGNQNNHEGKKHVPSGIYQKISSGGSGI